MQGIYCFMPLSSLEPLELLRQYIPSAEDPIVFFILVMRSIVSMECFLSQGIPSVVEGER